MICSYGNYRLISIIYEWNTLRLASLMMMSHYLNQSLSGEGYERFSALQDNRCMFRRFEDTWANMQDDFTGILGYLPRLQNARLHCFGYSRVERTRFRFQKRIHTNSRNRLSQRILNNLMLLNSHVNSGHVNHAIEILRNKNRNAYVSVESSFISYIYLTDKKWKCPVFFKAVGHNDRLLKMPAETLYLLLNLV